MKVGTPVQLNRNEYIIDEVSLLRPGQLGFVVGHKPGYLLVLSPGGIEWMWKGFLKRVSP